ncbi:MAG: hypothetical protein ABFD08_13260, partial [Syntrophomonas sp.]
RENHYLQQDNILDYEYNSKRLRKKTTNLSTEIWDRIGYNPKVAKLWNKAGIRTARIPENVAAQNRSIIEQIQKTSQMDNNTGSSLPKVLVSKEELRMIPGIITKSNMNLYRTKGGKFEISRKVPDQKRLHRIAPGMNAASSMPEDFSKYSSMDFHRPAREPDYERNEAKPRSEEIINNQLYRYEGEIKIDQANMQRIVNNVYNEIERRLEFERERRGL